MSENSATRVVEDRHEDGQIRASDLHRMGRAATTMASRLMTQVRDIAAVTTAAARGG
ncbi:hypothetical protein [Streptomyces sp. NPDC007929]|uniref:hypothetical protein n=1 Tax=unclassified Streptomyces TaxID=2593676 RepID=UPI0036E68464